MRTRDAAAAPQKTGAVERFDGELRAFADALAEDLAETLKTFPLPEIEEVPLPELGEVDLPDLLDAELPELRPIDFEALARTAPTRRQGGRRSRR